MADDATAGLAKATLRVKVGDPPRKELKFLYNPTEYTITKGTTWNRPQAKGAKSAGRPEFGGTNPQTVQLEIFFDDWETGAGTVADDVACLLEWTKPTGKSVGKKKPEPPILALEWGTNPALGSFQGALKSITAKYTLFDDQGMPIRATANITLEEIPVDAAKQNPTSGGRHGYRSHVLRQGDSLSSIAYDEYGDPSLWRALAVFNGLDDPLRVPIGISLLIPEGTEAKRLAES
jgi:nucleoid-associated protein YgaU